jgi:hypothetical protein
MKHILRKSPRVGLVLIGSLAMTACNETAMQRDIYSSREECARDWGDKPANCEPMRDAHTGFWHYYSPGYAIGSRPGYVHEGLSHAIGTHVTRGGFGASAAAHAAGIGAGS